MILPMPAMPQADGPPSSYMKSMEQMILFMLGLQSVATIMRCVLLLDIMGAFLMGIAVGIGWYAYKSDLNITYFCYWGFMCACQGVFDLIHLIDISVKNKFIPFSSQESWQYNLAGGTLVAAPLVLIGGAVMAWYMYKGHTASDSGSGVYEGPYNARVAGERAQTYGAAPPRASFQSFAGDGQRLGNS